MAANYWINLRSQRDDHPTKRVLVVSRETEGGVWSGRGMSVGSWGLFGVLCWLFFPVISPESVVELFSYSCCW